MAGENLLQIGKLLGQRRHSTAAGYAHLADAYLVETAEKVASIIADAMDIHIVPPSSSCERRRYGR